MAESNVRHEEEEDRDPCGICLNELTGEIGIPEGCNHEFCFECIMRWVEQSNTCPMDRHSFDNILVRSHAGGPVIRREEVESAEPFDMLEEELTLDGIIDRSMPFLNMLRYEGIWIVNGGIGHLYGHYRYPIYNETGLPYIEPLHRQWERSRARWGRVEPSHPRRERVEPSHPRRERVEPLHPRRERVEPSHPRRERVEPSHPRRERVEPSHPRREREEPSRPPRPLSEPSSLPHHEPSRPGWSDGPRHELNPDAPVFYPRQS